MLWRVLCSRGLPALRREDPRTALTPKHPPPPSRRPTPLTPIVRGKRAVSLVRGKRAVSLRACVWQVNKLFELLRLDKKVFPDGTSPVFADILARAKVATPSSRPPFPPSLRPLALLLPSSSSTCSFLVIIKKTAAITPPFYPSSLSETGDALSLPGVDLATRSWKQKRVFKRRQQNPKPIRVDLSSACAQRSRLNFRAKHCS